MTAPVDVLAVMDRAAESAGEIVKASNIVDRQLNDTELLAMARRAYLLADSAQSNIQRLKKYARKTEGMKRDLQRYQATYAENSQLHDKIMRGLL